MSIPVHSQTPLVLSSSTPFQANFSASKLVDKSVLDASGIQHFVRDATSVVDLTASSSTSGNLPPVSGH